MRICLVSSEIAPIAGGGAGEYARQMALALARAGHGVHLLTYPHPGLATLHLPGVSVHSIDLDRGMARVRAWHGRAMRHAVGVHEALERLHAEHRFEAIEFPDFGAEAWCALLARESRGAYTGAILALRAHMPIFQCDRLNRVAERGRRAATVEFMERFCYEHADIVIAPSSAMLADLRAMGVSLRRSAVVPNPMRIDAEREPFKREPIVVVSGRLEWRKGQDLAVRAMQRLLAGGVACRLVLAGRDTKTGPLGTSMRAHLESIIEPRFSGRIEFAGPLGRADLDALLARAACSVFPSRYENYPYAVAEAIALGSPAIVSDVGGMRELVGDHGLVVPAEDAESLASAIERVLRAPEPDALARCREHVAKQMDPARVVQQTLAAWQEVTPRARPLRQLDTAVVVPLFDLGAFLPETLDALAQQTRPPSEVIVVDDASRDEPTRALVERLERRGWPHLRVRVLRHASNAGPAAARNTGWRAAGAEAVVFLDADDVPARTLVERLAVALERDAQAAIATPWHARFEGERPDSFDTGWVPIGIDPEQLLAWNTCGGGSGVALRRAWLERVGGYDESMPGYEDWDLCCRLALRGGRAAVVPEFLLWRRLRDDGLFRASDQPRHRQLRAELMRRHGELASRAGDAMRLLIAEGR